MSNLVNHLRKFDLTNNTSSASCDAKKPRWKFGRHTCCYEHQSSAHSQCKIVHVSSWWKSNLNSVVFVNVTCRVHSEMYTHSRVETDVRVGENLISVDCVNHPHLGNVADTFPIMLRPKAKRVFYLPAALQRSSMIITEIQIWKQRSSSGLPTNQLDDKMETMTNKGDDNDW